MRAGDLETLELANLLSALAGHAVSEAGAAGCRELRARTTRSAVAEELARVGDAREITENERAPLGSFPDIRPLLAPSRTPGVIIEAAHCLEVAELLEMTQTLRVWLRTRAAQKKRLLASADRLDPLPELRDLLHRCLNPDGGLKDDASPELRAIRHRLRTLRSNIESRLSRLFQRSGAETTFADTYVTIRNGRFVVPVRAGSAGALPGIVQDRSASGETIFVEPLTAIEDNNGLLLAAREELEEEARILAELTATIGAHADTLGANMATLVDLDTLFARVAFARKHDAVCPTITHAAIHLPRARHPLLELTGRAVTPIEIELKEDTRLLVVTGPNTGGKSVALKTLGLAALMAQCGIPILADAAARLPVFDGIFTDIGDRQNVADDLSTFSGHVVNLGEILANASENSLILLDEPGTGTDPEDGASLARVLLDELAERGAHVLATTHFQSVKVAALSRPHARVAAVDFDPDTFAPRYSLIYDSVGPSLGMHMARRLGLPAALIDRAEAERHGGGDDFGKAIAELEGQRKRLAEEEERTATLRVGLAAARSEQDRLLDELHEKKKRKWADELGAARRFAEELRREGRRLLDEARRQPKEHASALVDLARNQRQAIGEAARRRDHSRSDDAAETRPARVGDRVEVVGSGLVGEVIGIAGERAQVARGKVRFDVALDQLKRLSGKPALKPADQSGGFRVQRAHPAESDPAPSQVELNLIGERVRPALEQLEKFLDSQVMESWERVRIVHGHGTGALRQAVREFLTNSPHVEHIEDAPRAQGGTGATLAFLHR
jgi:DNA mismatch repair protein MutS2